MKHFLIFLCCLSAMQLSCEGPLNADEPGLLVPKTVDQDALLPSIKVNNTQLHSEAFGDPSQPMLVVLHGGPGLDYRPLLNCKSFAAEGYYVVFYDQRGSGLSRRESKSTYTTGIMLDDLDAVISYYRSSSNQKIFLLGQSWGAILATAYINQHPEAISGVVLAEPGGFIWNDIKDYMARTRKYDLQSETLNDATYMDQFLTAKESEQEKLDYKFGLLASSDGAPDSPLGDEGKAPFWRMGALVNQVMYDLGKSEQPDWTKNLSAFKTKVLFVYSEHNKAYGAAYAEHVSSAYPNVELKRIDATGHHLMTFPAGWSNFKPVALEYLNELR